MLLFTLLLGAEVFAAVDQKKSETAVNCANKNAASAACANVKRVPVKKDSPPVFSRKPPKAPKQISPVMDELPERREDDF